MPAPETFRAMGAHSARRLADGRRPFPASLVPALAGALLFLGGCVLTPKGAKEERAHAADIGRRYEAPFEERSLPDLPERPAWRDVLHRALLANGDLEAAYFDWKAALERIDIAGAYPNSNVMLGYSYLLSSERMK